ncbi:MAG: hypothetical protein ACI311_06825 [Bacilli bacterium]
MLSKKKLYLILCLSTLSLISTGFSSWVISVPEDDTIGIITVSDLIEINWLSSDASSATKENGISFIYSKNNGIKEFTKNYYNFNLLVDVEAFQVDVTSDNIDNAYLNCSFIISDSRFYIEKIVFYSSGISYTVNNSERTSAFSKVILINDKAADPNLYTFISNTISNSLNTATIMTQVYVNIKDDVEDFTTSFEPCLTFAIEGGY